MKTYKVKVNGKLYEVQLEEVSENSEKISAPAPATVDPDILKQVVGDDEIITCRPADLLQPEFESLKEKYSDIARSDEDVLSLALFENVATDFLKKKYSTDEVEEFNIII